MTSKYSFSNTVLERIGAGITLVYSILAPFFVVIAIVLAFQWIQQPFLGVFVGNTLVLSEYHPLSSHTSSLNPDAFSGYRIRAIDNELISNISHLNQKLQKFRAGQTIPVTLLSREDETVTVMVTLVSFSLTDFLVMFMLPCLIGLAFIGMGIWAFRSHRRDAQGKTFLIFAISAGLSLLLSFDALTTNQFVFLRLFTQALTGASMIALGFIYPAEDALFTHRPIVRWFGLSIGLILLMYAIPWQFNQAAPYQYLVAVRYHQLFISLAFLCFVGMMIYRLRFAGDPKIREQSRLTLIGAVLSVFPLLIWLISGGWFVRIPFSPVLWTSFVIFPITLAYNLTNTRNFRTEFIASQTLLYATLIALSSIGYGLLVTGAALITHSSLSMNNPFLVGIMFFVLALIFLPLRERLQKAINKAFGQDIETYRLQIQNFSRELTQSLDIQGLNQLVRSHLEESLAPEQIHIFLQPPGSDYYAALPDQSGQPTSELVFTTDSNLVKVLSARKAAIYIGNLKSTPDSLQAERSRLSLLGSQIFVPLPGRQRLIGWIGLGSKRNGQLYSQRDLDFLETISDQTALAFERAQVIQDLEQRIHQMDVLTRMTQGINVTASFDDLLELIYAQSSQILPSRDFRIALVDQRSGSLTYVFYLENDDRLKDREKLPVPVGIGLEQEVFRQGKLIITQDYELECRNFNVVSDLDGIYAWIGVPLNTGDETIGVLSLGSRDPTVVYTSDQARLLQAIADQAAGAILKARLLEEAEQRARQLATLNIVAQSLSSTLELAPLLNKILSSAVEILNCEAGSLLLIDQETGEYVFEAAVGPVGDTLIGTRLPAGTGLVGKAVANREAIILNDVRRSKDWSVKIDHDTGFKTNDLLVVPMIYRDEVIGVIEALNRRDGQPFAQDDQELLSAFASQAAVALENARLFTLTDQTLAERVEELSVLQRIDRELNTSLDINRALWVTLDWAMHQSNADAGLIGILEEDKVRIMASQGYASELREYETTGLPLDFPAIQIALESRFPQLIQISESDNRRALLSEAHHQVVVSIRRESLVIGVILLESRSQVFSPEEKLGFLNRLADHASIAITNAKLYAEVQAANQAKSDFVSFVSHELKTPMTSIRGFTDLLASGIVGAINENQANFLNTIRSNVDRMATLVSDLADVSRIEAGRLRLEFSAVPVNEVIDEVVRSTRAQILEKKQTLIVNAPENLPPFWGDRVRLIQILTNLVSNAYKYTQPEGLIQIQVEVAENKWTEGANQVIHVAVKDNGYGISPEDQPKIFQKFYRSEDQKIRDAPGTGLGLNITKQLVELQGGAIWFESQHRSGTTFHFTIPIAESE